MLALIAGTGDLPAALVARLPKRPLICALAGFAPTMPPDVTFRLEHLGSFLADLKLRGIRQVCMAGAVKRPEIDPAQIDAATLPLIPKVQAAIAKGDDGALRILIGLLEDSGFKIVAAHDIAMDLLPQTGVLTKASPADWHKRDAQEGESCIARMGAADSGQACVIRLGQVVATEGPEGTDAMLSGFCDPYPERKTYDPLSFGIDILADWLSAADAPGNTADDGILFKAPKPGQDRRADLPLIGVTTAMKAAEAGLAGIVIEAGGVMVLDLPGVISTLDAQKMFLWVRPKGGA